MADYRINAREKLGLCLLPQHAYDLEKAIYNHTCEYTNLKDTTDYFIMIYNTKLADLLFNLNQRNSPLLLLDIVNEKVNVKDLPYMTPEELNVVMWAPITKKREYINYKKNNRETTKAYKCRKCGKRECTVVEMMARSADEPMTQFITCQNCNYRFRIG